MLARPGASDAFKAELVSLMPRVRNFLGCLIKNALLADEMTQETMLLALEHHDQFHYGNMASWLITIARHEWYSRCRKERRRRAWEYDPDYDNVPASDSQEDVLELKDVFWLMDCLPAKRRDVLQLAAAGYGFDEIAVLLDMPIGSAKSRCFRAREQLAKMRAAPRCPKRT